MDKQIKNSQELNLKRAERRKFLKAIGVAGGIVLAYPLVRGIESFSDQEGVKGLWGRILEQRNNDAFKELQKYKVGEKDYTAQPYDSYARIISQETREHPFLKNFDGSDLREFYRSLNKDKDMKQGARYTLPVWKDN
ncbi:MAG: hypothetical protein ABIH28_01955 [archaeon]